MNMIMLGATGFVGRLTLQQALAQPEIQHVTSISRRSTNIDSDKLNETVMPLTRLNQAAALFKGDVLVLALGANMQSGGSYRQVDLEFGIEAAKLARQQGITRCVAVSSALSSRVSPSGYLRIKAQFEQQLAQLGFEQLSILKPGPLLGRPQARWQESLLNPLFGFLAWLSGGKGSPIRPVTGQQVADCLIRCVLSMPSGTRKLSSRDICDGRY